MFKRIFFMVFVTTVLMAQGWDATIHWNVGDSLGELGIGGRNWATASYDLFYDIPYLGTPLDSAVMFNSFEVIFDIPMWLTTDRRKTSDVFSQWEVFTGSGLLGSEIRLSWDIAELPEGEWTIFWQDSVRDMSEATEFWTRPLNTVRIRRAIRPIDDPTPPLISLVAPMDGDTGVSINTVVKVDIVDEDSWVDDTTITVTSLDGVFFTKTQFPVQGGYQIKLSFIVDLPTETNVSFIVRAKNVADFPAETIDTLNFTTSSIAEIYRLSGHVFSEDSLPIADAGISLMIWDSLVSTASTDAFGEYTFSAITSGLRFIEVTHAEYETKNAVVYIWQEEQRKDITMQMRMGIADVFLPETVKFRAFPNPFNPSVRLEGDVEHFHIYDLSGRQVADLVSQEMGACVWTPDAGLESGVYLVRSDNQEENDLKIVLIR